MTNDELKKNSQSRVKMGQQTIPTDEQNICLKCAHSVYTEGNKIKPNGYDYFYTMCGCWLSIKGKNVGHRRTCNRFLESEEKNQRYKNIVNEAREEEGKDD